MLVGNVPIISNSPMSATTQFALHDNSLFNAGDSDDLAKKIDFWIENPKLRDEYEHKYSESAKNYSLKNSIMKIEEMFYEDISERRKS